MIFNRSQQWVTWEDPISDPPHQMVQHESFSLGDAVHVCQYGIQPTSSWSLICRHKPGQQQWWHVIALEEASCCNLKRGLKVASLRHKRPPVNSHLNELGNKSFSSSQIFGACSTGQHPDYCTRKTTQPNFFSILDPQTPHIHKGLASVHCILGNWGIQQ